MVRDFLFLWFFLYSTLNQAVFIRICSLLGCVYVVNVSYRIVSYRIVSYRIASQQQQQQQQQQEVEEKEKSIRLGYQINVRGNRIDGVRPEKEVQVLLLLVGLMLLLLHDRC